MPAPHHSVFLQAGCPSCRPTNSVKALKAHLPEVTETRLAAGLRPEPLGELERSPDPLAAIGGGVLLLSGRERRKGEREGSGKGMEREG